MNQNTDLTQATSATEKIISSFDENKVIYKLLHHSECRTSEESAKTRAEAGAGIIIGAKAILMKIELKQAGSEYSVFVLPGDKLIDSKNLKKSLKARFSNFKSFRFSTPEEMADITNGLQPGTMPPFGQPIFENISHLFVDSTLLEHDVVGFNAACLTQSLIVDTEAYIKVASPSDIFLFSA